MFVLVHIPKIWRMFKNILFKVISSSYFCIMCIMRNQLKNGLKAIRSYSFCKFEKEDDINLAKNYLQHDKENESI